jgi:hypothetical protein
MNDQESRTSKTVSLVLSLVTVTIDMFLLGLILWQTTFFRPRFQGIFKDFDVQLPAYTALLLSIPGKVYVVTAACIGIILMVKEITISNQSIKLGINMVSGVALLAFAVLFHLALLLPWMSLMQNLR